jgi:hypothetical protein
VAAAAAQVLALRLAAAVMVEIPLLELQLLMEVVAHLMARQVAAAVMVVHIRLVLA